jgi:Domain of unknown function (DUF4214)
MTYINWTKEVFVDPITFAVSAEPGGIPIPTYGNYGGPDYSNGAVGGTIPLTGALAPVDQLDALFFTHDLAYQLQPSANEIPTADLALIHGIESLTAAGSLDAEASFYAGATILGVISFMALNGNLPSAPELALANATASYDIEYGLSHLSPTEQGLAEAATQDIAAAFIKPLSSVDLNLTEALYVGYFGRAGDPQGTKFWTSVLDSDFSIQQEAASFSVQAESQALYPFLANPLGATESQIATFIESVYQDLFNRSPDVNGLAYWTNFLNANLGNPEAVGSFILDVISGAQNSAAGLDQTTIHNKIAVADWLTNAFAVAGIENFGGGISSSANAVAHTLIASVTSDPATVTSAELSFEAGVVGLAAHSAIANLGSHGLPL